MSRRALVLTIAAAVVASGCHGYRHRSSAPPSHGSGSGGAAMPVTRVSGEHGEKLLENLPWHPDVIRANLGANGPVAIAQIYVMRDDLLVVDASGRLYCLSRRDLTPRWVSSLRYAPSAPPAENADQYVWVERAADGAAYLQWFSRRSGAEANASPARLPYAPSTGVSATASTAYLGSLGSPLDNKTLETVNLADGTQGWGYRTTSRIVATPTLDPNGDVLIVVSEDRTLTSFPAAPAGQHPAGVNWERETLGTNSSAPAMTKDWMFLGSEDNFLRCYDIGSGEVRWMSGTDAPIKRSPWLLGGMVTKEVALGGEGSGKAKVELFEGTVFVRNELGLHAYDAETGDKVFSDRDGVRPLVRYGEWTLTVDSSGGAQVRKGKGLPVSSTVNLGMFDFLPTNSRDGTVVAGTTSGLILIAVPK